MSENGLSFNGLSFNGLSFNGLSFNGLSFNGLSFNGLSFNGLSFNGGLLTGTVDGLGEVDAFAAIGSELHGQTTDGTPIVLRIDDVQQSEERGNEDIYHYWVSVARETTRTSCTYSYTLFRWVCRTQTTTAWYPICDDGRAALAIPGEWLDCEGPGCGGRGDADAFTFACRESTMAKCAEDLGYAPWRRNEDLAGRSSTLLADHHEACVRMLRGDYCGNGIATTVDGTEIDVWDDLSPAVQTRAGAPWGFEAAWAPNGAYCVSQVRLDQQVSDAISHFYGLSSDATVADYVREICDVTSIDNVSFGDGITCWEVRGPWNEVSDGIDEYHLANTSSTIPE